MPAPPFDFSDLPAAPDYVRALSWVVDGKSEAHSIRMWSPRRARNGGWLCFVEVSWVPTPHPSFIPGIDEMDALIHALAHLRGAVDAFDPELCFWHMPSGGLPRMINHGMSVEATRALESQLQSGEDKYFQKFAGRAFTQQEVKTVAGGQKP